MTTLAPAEEIILTRLLPELVRLSLAARLEAIQQLAKSMQEDASALPRKSLLDFAGAWVNDADADAMEEAIRNGRYSEIKPHLEGWN